jgi:UDP-glucose 4-epimerase
MNLKSTARKTVLITGGCGYLGSQLIRDLGIASQQDGLRIRILDNMQTKNYRSLMDLDSKVDYHFIEGDILDPAVVAFALQDVDLVVHLAAIVQTPMSFENPTWVEQVNYWGTARLIESCLDAGVKHFLYASSSAVYGPGGPFTEKDICRPFGAYAQSKYKAERSVLSAIERGLEPIVLRFGTLYGVAPSVRFEAVANRFAYLAGAQRPLVVFGQGDQVRPFIHIRDASAAVQFSMEHWREMSGQIFNAVGINASILDLVEAVKSFLPEIRVRYTEQDVLTHLSIKVSNEKLTGMGWQPAYSLEDGLRELVDQFSGLRGA